MVQGVQTVVPKTPEGRSAAATLLPATLVAQSNPLHRSANGILYTGYGENNLPAADLDRMVQAVPATIAAALGRKAYYFVPLTLAERAASGGLDAFSEGQTMVASDYSAELSDQAICHRNVSLETIDAGLEGVFISTRLLGDRFALAFEFFINVGHAFVDSIGVPPRFADLVWSQARTGVRGETSQDAWENRNLALPSGKPVDTLVDEGNPGPDPNRAPGGAPSDPKAGFFESAFSDAVAIYQLSLAVDFDYAELREREYPLLAPNALADRLRLVAQLFPANPDYEFAIRYRRR